MSPLTANQTRIVAPEASGPVLGRIHLDVVVDDRHAEARRLAELGGALREERDDHLVMLDPEGNRFCLFDR